jgi:hypothetical protein
LDLIARASARRVARVFRLPNRPISGRLPANSSTIEGAYAPSMGQP